jgi:hypothetical protein
MTSNSKRAGGTLDKFFIPLWDLSNKNHLQFNVIKVDTILYKYVCTKSIRVTIAEELPNISRIILTD